MVIRRHTRRNTSVIGRQRAKVFSLISASGGQRCARRRLRRKMSSMSREDTTLSSPSPEQLAWVREAIDGLRHAQNIAVAVLGGAMGLLAAAVFYFATEVGGLEEKITTQIRDSETRVVAQMSHLQTTTTDTRERVIRLEERTQEIAVQAQIISVQSQEIAVQAQTISQMINELEALRTSLYRDAGPR